MDTIIIDLILLLSAVLFISCGIYVGYRLIRLRQLLRKLFPKANYRAAIKEQRVLSREYLNSQQYHDGVNSEPPSMLRDNEPDARLLRALQDLPVVESQTNRKPVAQSKEHEMNTPNATRRSKSEKQTAI